MFVFFFFEPSYFSFFFNPWNHDAAFLGASNANALLQCNRICFRGVICHEILYKFSWSFCEHKKCCSNWKNITGFIFIFIFSIAATYFQRYLLSWAITQFSQAYTKQHIVLIRLGILHCGPKAFCIRPFLTVLKRGTRQMKIALRPCS